MEHMNFKEFLNHTHKALSLRDSKSLQVLKTTGYLEEGQSSMGGVLVPQEAWKEILDVSLEESIVRPQAKVVKMGSDTITISRLVDTTHASSCLGGITCTWGAEAAIMSETNPSFGSMTLNARSLTGYCYTSSEWLNDARPSAEELLIQAFGEAIAWYCDAAYFTGTGVNEPLGVINAPCHIPVAKETGQIADTVWEDNIKNMSVRLDPRSEDHAKWYINQEVKAQLKPLRDKSGNASVLQMQVNDERKYLDGYRLHVTEKCPKVGDHGDIILGDFRRYLIADRELRIQSSAFYKFSTDQITWRFVYRGDGQPIPANAYIPKNATSSTTVSPFITLAARA